MAELLYKIGRFAARRRGTVIVVWLLLLAAAAAAFTLFAGTLSDQVTIPGTPTAQVTDRLEADFPAAVGATGMVVFTSKNGAPINATQKTAIAERIAGAKKLDGVDSVYNPFTTQAEKDRNAKKIADGRKKLAKARRQIADGKRQIPRAKAKLRSGQKQLNAAKRKLASGQAQLNAARAKLPAAQAKINAGRAKLAAAQAKLNAAKRPLVAGQAKLNAARQKTVAGQTQLNAAKADLAAKQAQLDGAIAQAKADGTYEQMAATFAAMQAAIDAGRGQINAKQAALTAAKATLAKNQAKIDTGWAKVRAGQAKINAGRAQLAQGQAQLNAGRSQIAANQAKINAGRSAIKKNQAKIKSGWATIHSKEIELRKAPAKVAAAQKKLDRGAALLGFASGLRLVSEDGSAAAAMVMFKEPQLSVTQASKDGAMDAFRHDPVPGVSVDFSSAIAAEMPALIGPTEGIGIIIAGGVLLVLLRTLIGAALPLLTAIVGVGIATLAALSLSGKIEMMSVTPILGIMLGLAVGIDYALFIVNRHRRQLREGYSVEESIALANGTSGNAVVFAGTTVIIALAALSITGIPFLGLMGGIGAAAVAIAVLIAVTLTPALLSLVGMRILRRSETARVAAGEHATPQPAKPLPTWRALGQVVVGLAVLAVISLPVGSMRLGLPDGSSEPASSTQYRAYTAISEKLGEGENGMLLVIADLPKGTTADQLQHHQIEVARSITSLGNVSAVAPVLTSKDRTIAAFQVVPKEGPTSVSTENLVHDIRNASPLPGGIKLGVAGLTSGAIDISQKLADALPIYLGVVLILSLLIMIVVFRSLLVPLVASGGFALSLFAALGGTIAIYQWGWLGGLFGVTDPGPILNFMPTMLAGILFGLAMDYTLFLASGMREAYVHGAPARTAVVLGFNAGRSVVIAAAIIMVSVFGGFVFSESAMIRPIGFALAFGVLLDALVVRMVVLPGLIHLLGERAWWLPRWLDRIIPNVDVEGAALEREHPHVAQTPAADTPADEAEAAAAATAVSPAGAQAAAASSADVAGVVPSPGASSSGEPLFEEPA